MPFFQLKTPKPHTEFRSHNGRLTLFHKVDDARAYWERYWNEVKRNQLATAGHSGDLGEFDALVRRYVPPHLPVLEAGCGPAHLVLALQQHGYDVVGIDYEPEVVRFVQETIPGVQVREGNVLALDLEDGSLGCYLSIGVVEHLLVSLVPKG